MDGVVGRNSGESSSRIGGEEGEKGGNEGATRSDVVAERGIDIRPLEREEAVTHYQEASRWVHTLRAGELTLAPPPP